MIFYTVHLKNGEAPENYLFIKEGFNWYDFFFGVFWAVYNRIWSLALVHFSIFMSLALITQFNILSPIVANLISFFLSIAIAFHANDFYRESLVKKGYEFTDVIFSSNREQALLRFLEKNYKSP